MKTSSKLQSRSLNRLVKRVNTEIDPVLGWVYKANRLCKRGKIGKGAARRIRQLNRVLHGCDIGFGADIHPSCVFYHGGLGCVIHSKAVIGQNCRIFQNVTIGSAWRGGAAPGEYVPRVGDNVLLGAGCVLLGDITIGDGAIVGANAVVTKDVPPKAVVAGVPAKVISYVQ